MSEGEKSEDEKKKSRGQRGMEDECVVTRKAGDTKKGELIFFTFKLFAFESLLFIYLFYFCFQVLLESPCN